MQEACLRVSEDLAREKPANRAIYEVEDDTLYDINLQVADQSLSTTLCGCVLNNQIEYLARYKHAFAPVSYLSINLIALFIITNCLL
jgi:hypothetical protein